MTRIVHIAMVTCMLATMGIASAQSTHDGFGATVYQDDGGWGTSFRTWTPNADAVYVTGSFNGWGTNTHQLVAEDGDDGRVVSSSINDNTDSSSRPAPTPALALPLLLLEGST